MATEVVMPRLGWTMEVGRVVEWLKNDGDMIEEGDLILAIESDKAVNEVEASSRIDADQEDQPRNGQEFQTKIISG